MIGKILISLSIISLFAIANLSPVILETEPEEEPIDNHPVRTNRTKTKASTCDEIKEALKADKKTVRDCHVGPKGVIYFRIENRLVWEEARDTCRLIENSDLVSIHNFDEKALMNSMALNNYYNDYYEWDQRQGSWIGLHRKNMSCDNEMEWTDGTPLDYQDFIQDEPNCRSGSDPEHCVYAHRRVTVSDKKQSGVVAGWNDGECEMQLKSICKMTSQS